jgi:hypothetical protein
MGGHSLKRPELSGETIRGLKVAQATISLWTVPPRDSNECHVVARPRRRLHAWR